jgi:hypothetical protein
MLREDLKRTIGIYSAGDYGRINGTEIRNILISKWIFSGSYEILAVCAILVLHNDLYTCKMVHIEAC